MECMAEKQRRRLVHGIRWGVVMVGGDTFTQGLHEPPLIPLTDLLHLEKRLNILLHLLLGLEAILRPVMVFAIILQEKGLGFPQIFGLVPQSSQSVVIVEISPNKWYCGATSAAKSFLYLIDWCV